jgi:hypothetical protein
MSLPHSHRPHRPGRPTIASDTTLLNTTEPPKSALNARNTRPHLPRCARSTAPLATSDFAEKRTSGRLPLAVGTALMLS